MAAVAVREEVADVVIRLAILDLATNLPAHVDGDVGGRLRHRLVFADDAADFAHEGLCALLKARIGERRLARHLDEEGKEKRRNHAGAPAGAATGSGAVAGGSSVSVT